MHKLAQIAVAVALCLALLPATSQVGAAGQLAIVLDPPKAPRGTTITINGSNAAPGSQITIIFGFFGDLNDCLTNQLGQGDRAGTATADGQGRFTLQHQPFSGVYANVPNQSVRYLASGADRDPSPWTCFEVGDPNTTPPPPLPGPSPAPGGEPLCFPGLTAHCVRGLFRDQWEQRGGLAINGYPISGEFVEALDDGVARTVQYFERVRMELHTDQATGQPIVLLGQFGRKIQPEELGGASLPGALYFPETGHNVTRPEFIAFWQQRGGLPQFGYAITEEFSQKLENGQTYRVQYFERARFEFHPEIADPAQRVQLGQFGRIICGDRCR